MVQGCVCLVGGRKPVTLYVVPKLNCVGKVKGTSPVTNKLSPTLSCNSIVSPLPITSPVTAPPTENFGTGHEICTLATLPLIVPLAFETTQVWPGLTGCVRIVPA